MTGKRRSAGIATAAVLLLGAAPAHAETAIALLPGNSLISFDTDTPGTVTGPTPVTGLGSTQTLRGIDFRPTTGELYGVAVTSGSANNSLLFTYRIDPATGAATLIGDTGVPVAGAGDVPSGYDFNPTVTAAGVAIDRIRYVNTNDENARINPNNGARADAPTSDTDLTPAATTDIIAAAYDRNTGTSAQSGLWEIDTNSDTLSVQGGLTGAPSANGGVVTDIGSLALALNAGTDAGFDVSPTGQAFAALTAGGVTGLYRINLSTAGVTTLIGNVGGSPAQVYSLAIVPPDTDADGVRDAADNCPAVANDQADLDADGAGDACDPDQDGDGLSDAVETAIGSDPRSTDSDGDGVGDGADACPALAGTQANGCPDVALPDTTITKAPKKKSTKRKATVEFTSTEPGSTFACSLDRKPFVTCSSPTTYKKLKVGKHFVDIRAIDSAGNLDPTPATVAWRVKPKKRK